MTRFLKLSTPLNNLAELASLAYEIEGPRTDVALERAIAALKRANPTLKAGIGGIPRGTILVPTILGLRMSDKTEPAASAHAARIDALTEVIEAYEASLKESSASRRADNVKRFDLVRSEPFLIAIGEAVRDSRGFLDKLALKVEADQERDEERHKQIQAALDRMKEDLQMMRKRVS